MKSVAQLKENFITILDEFDKNRRPTHGKGLRFLNIFQRKSKLDKEYIGTLRHLVTDPLIDNHTAMLKILFDFASRELEVSGSSLLLQQILHCIADEIGMEKKGRHNQSLSSLAQAYACACGCFERVQQSFYQRLQQQLEILG